ncbi:MAG TPA: 5'-3' exonuclease H3TH domain-containing protein, partial [Lacipirellulaceae bacterium]|nr:5'-3' exonuclease H3TH domain-containing protein [Lacipirellulaceae bacterium]
MSTNSAPDGLPPRDAASRQARLPGMEPEGQPPGGPPPRGAAPPPEALLHPPGPVYAVDSHSLIFQVFHAMAGSELTSPRGEPVGAVYGFIRDLLQIIEKRRPAALVCAFDMPGPTFRHDLYEAYKADRGEMPEELSAQIPMIRAVVDALAVPILESPGYEADDILAAIARMCDEAQVECRLVTGDKDCRQLISDYVAVYNIRKDETYDRAALAADWGIAPHQVVDFQALVGDKVDNVPGVPLIGPKVARELLEQYGSLTAVLDHADDVAGAKRRQNLKDYREAALLSRKLVELDRQTPVAVDWQAARVGGFDSQRVGELFRAFGFRSLADRVAALVGAPKPALASDASSPEAHRTPQPGSHPP